MKNKFTFAISAVLFFSMMHLASSAQTPHTDFTYDAAGNRILRQWFAQKGIASTPEENKEAEKIAEQNGIVVYPNPVQDDNINISIASLKSDVQSTIEVLDNSGKVLVQQKVTAALTSINISAYSAGIYYIRVMAGKEQLYYKITKAK
jgi:hypothetical protein